MAKEEVSNETPWSRIANALSVVTTPVAPGDDVPPPPKALIEWGQHTTAGVAAGIIYGAFSQWSKERTLGSFEPPKGVELTTGQLTKLRTEFNTQRLLRYSRQTSRAGLAAGGLAGMFYGIQALSAVARGGEERIFDTVFAATCTGAAFGLIVPGGSLMRLGSAGLGAALGAGVSYPTALLQQKVLSMAPEAIQKELATREAEAAAEAAEVAARGRYRSSDHDSAADVIRLLEASLQNGPKGDSS